MLFLALSLVDLEPMLIMLCLSELEDTRLYTQLLFIHASIF